MDYVIDLNIYNRAALEMARSEYAEFCDVVLGKDEDGKCQMTIRVKDGYKSDEESICDEFLNYCLGTSLRKNLSAA